MKAVLDLGTNTFHLLIAEKMPGETRFTERQFRAVKLGEGGINKKEITPAAFARGINTLREYRQIIDRYPVDEIRAIATSAVRSAANGQAFCEEAFRQTGIRIETINGDEEAAYIFAGVQLSCALDSRPALVMDIGGGSVEFIIGDEKKLFWKKSVEVGAARLMDLFHRNDPLSPGKIMQAETYFDQQLQDVFDAVQHFHPVYLVGSAGAFESYAELISPGKIAHAEPAYPFDPTKLLDLLDLLISSTHAQRENMKGLIELRVDMIVMASLLTRHILRRTGISEARLSSYALKEGVLHRLFSNT